MFRAVKLPADCTGALMLHGMPALKEGRVEAGLGTVLVAERR
jgi:hypothetical protein